MVPCCVRFLAHFYTILKKRITPADSLQAALAQYSFMPLAADCRDLRRYLFCPLFFVMAADFSSFHFICTVSCTIRSKVFVANTISDSLALLPRHASSATADQRNERRAGCIPDEISSSRQHPLLKEKGIYTYDWAPTRHQTTPARAARRARQHQAATDRKGVWTR